MFKGRVLHRVSVQKVSGAIVEVPCGVICIFNVNDKVEYFWIFASICCSYFYGVVILFLIDT